MPEIVVRCSSLPRIMRCPASELSDLVKGSPDTDEEAGTLGQVVHDLLRDYVSGRTCDPHSAAIAHDLDPDDVAPLFHVGVRLWRERLKNLFPAAVIEERDTRHLGGGVTITGQTDLDSAVDDEARILDWKSGRVDSDHRHQMMGYASLALSRTPEAKRVVAVVVWLRTQEADIYEVTADEVREWERSVVARLSSWDGEYHPGPACTYCPRQLDCPGRSALVRRSIDAFVSEEAREERHANLSNLTPDQILSIYDRCALVDKAVKSMKFAIREHVAELGEVVGAERRIKLTEIKRREVDASAAWDVLLDEVPDGKLAECIDVKLTAVENCVAKAAGKGNGAKAKRALAERLKAAGAVTIKPQKRLTVSKA